MSLSPSLPFPGSDERWRCRIVRILDPLIVDPTASFLRSGKGLGLDRAGPRVLHLRNGSICNEKMRSCHATCHSRRLPRFPNSLPCPISRFPSPFHFSRTWHERISFFERKKEGEEEKKSWREAGKFLLLMQQRETASFAGSTVPPFRVPLSFAWSFVFHSEQNGTEGKKAFVTRRRISYARRRSVMVLPRVEKDY